MNEVIALCIGISLFLEIIISKQEPVSSDVCSCSSLLSSVHKTANIVFNESSYFFAETTKAHLGL